MGRGRWRTPPTSNWSSFTIQTSRTTSTTRTRPSRFPQIFIKEARRSVPLFSSSTFNKPWFLFDVVLNVTSRHVSSPSISTHHSEWAELDSGAGEGLHGEQSGGSVTAVAGVWERHRSHTLLSRWTVTRPFQNYFYLKAEFNTIIIYSQLHSYTLESSR